jgi:hypothetical protein
MWAFVADRVVCGQGRRTLQARGAVGKPTIRLLWRGGISLLRYMTIE